MQHLSPEECLEERKWWCFLLSSILTFVMGVSGVFVMRVFKFIFCREVRYLFVNITTSKVCGGFKGEAISFCTEFTKK